jgi:hypothetical protein
VLAERRQELDTREQREPDTQVQRELDTREQRELDKVPGEVEEQELDRQT